MFRSALAFALLAAAPALAQDIAVEEAYAIAASPAAPMGAAYMVIRNEGAEPDRLLGASTPAAEAVELHGSAEVEGVMRMEAVEGGLEVPAGGELRLARGGEHLMLIGLAQPFEDGTEIEVTLEFERAGAVAVTVPVDLDRLADGSGGQGMDHSGEGEGHGGH